MERQELVNRVNGLNTRQDLLALLNDLKTDDLKEKAHPFTMKQLQYYCNPNKTARRYTQFEIRKKSGGMRQITAPVKTLKSLLKYVNMILQAMYEPMPCVMGFVPEKSVADNAKIHVGKYYVFNIDLKDFFPSVAQARVWKKLQFPPFNFKNDPTTGIQRRVIADVIAGMCCMKVDSDTYVLPQGAPTSPTLTNIICERLDRNLSSLAKKYGIIYTRYADDITFSSMHNVYKKDGEFVNELHRIIEEQGFTINPAKTRLSRVNQRQEVTGLTVNEKVNVTRRYVADIRHVLHAWQTKGYDLAYADFFAHYKREKGHVKKGIPSMENVLLGKLNYLKMIKGANDSTYLKLKERFDVLTRNRTIENTQYIDAKYRYLNTFIISQFEDTFNTELKIDESKNGKKYMYFLLEQEKHIVSISSKLDIKDIISQKHSLEISLCETIEGNRFYLAHRPIVHNNIVQNNENYLNNTLNELFSSNFANLEILLNHGTK